MRNHLAKEVLNAETHHLIGMYQKSLGGAGAEITATMELLKKNKCFKKIFRDKRPIVNSIDVMIDSNRIMMYCAIP